MGYYKELDIERIHQEEDETTLLASMQPVLGEELAAGELPSNLIFMPASQFGGRRESARTES